MKQARLKEDVYSNYKPKSGAEPKKGKPPWLQYGEEGELVNIIVDNPDVSIVERVRDGERFPVKTSKLKDK